MKVTIAANQALLEQGEELIQRVSDAAYGRAIPTVFGSSIGAHVRHNLDHYACLLKGLPAGRVDYATRARDTGMETDRAQALAELARLRLELGRLKHLPESLSVRRESSPDGAFAPSSPARELEFLLSHTVHHYAIVAILCRLQSIPVAAGFGVAPSTLRHRAALRGGTSAPRQDPCAP